MRSPTFGAAIGAVLCAAACNSEPPPLALAPAHEGGAPMATASASAAAAPPVDLGALASAALAGSAAPSAVPSATPASDVASAKQVATAAPSSESAASSMPSPPHGILKAGAADAILKLDAPSKIRVLKAGAEPRSTLAYAIAKGTKDTLTVAMDMTMGTKSGETVLPPTAMPRMAITLGMTITDKNPAGDAKVDAIVNAFDVQPKGIAQEQIAAAMRPALEGVKGLGLSYWVSPEGHVHDLEVKAGPSEQSAAQQALAGMNQSFESMVVPLPREPVGVGAEWEVVSRIASSGADLLQYSTYTLRSREGSESSLDVKVAQLAASESVQAPGFPPGVTARLRSFKSGGSGTNRIDTKSVAPRSGQLAVKSAMVLEVSQAGAAKPEQASVETSLEVHFIRPKP